MKKNILHFWSLCLIVACGGANDSVKSKKFESLTEVRGGATQFDLIDKKVDLSWILETVSYGD